MDELLGKRVPHNPQAEQSVLGSMLIDAACIPDVLRHTRAEYFYIQTNRDIFETISAMFAYGQTVDPVTVMEQMKIRGVFHEETTRAYILELMRITPTAANVSDYIAILADNALMRELGRVAGEISDKVNEGIGEADKMLEFAERSIYALRDGRISGGLRPVSEVITQVCDELNEMAASGAPIPGLSTGLADLDARILGLNAGELVVIASRPGMGKTSIAMNIAMSVARSGDKAVAIFSLEMSRQQLAMRLISGESRVDLQKLLRGSLNQDEWRRVITAADAISSAKILMDDNPLLSVADMNAQCRRVRDLGLVVIDYLQLMQSAGDRQRYNENRQVVVSEISRMLKIMAKELNVPVLCMSQLSRASETRQNRRPMLSDLRESGAIEQDADVVIGLYREGYYSSECENPNLAEAIVLKNRKGEVGTVELQWLPDYTTYVSIDWRHKDEN